MNRSSNLTVNQWPSVLGSYENATRVAERLQLVGSFVPWSKVLVNETAECESTADLGSGRGEHSAVLARAGRATTLMDWSQANIAFSERMFGELGLTGRFVQGDITDPLPFETRSIDAVFSCGVIEYFSGAQLDRVLAEMSRVARRRVIVMVPNASSLAYRVGKWYMERTGTWQWGGEKPVLSLRRPFARAGLVRIREYSVGARHALGFLTMRGGARLAGLVDRGLRLTDHSRPSYFRQGYLLVTVGDLPPGAMRP